MSSNTSRKREKEPDIILLSDEESDSDEEDEEYQQALREWEESVQQLKMLMWVVLLPWIGKWAGRKWAHWLHLRYLQTFQGAR